MKYHFFLTLFLLQIVHCQLFSQDLFDLSHTRAYAASLMRGQQFGLAGEEYERLLYMQPANDTFKIQLLKAYRLGQQTGRGMVSWQRWAQVAPVAPAVNYEYAKLLLYSGRAADALLFAERPDQLTPIQTQKTQLYAHLLLQDWPKAETELAQWPASAPLPSRAALVQLVQKGQHLPRKSPALAAGLSVVVPGLGKVYTRDWKDGAISAVFVGLNAWQAYRRFHREGIESPWGWVHTAFGAGFYIGNVYGAHKAARLYNQRQQHRQQHEIEHLLFPAFD